MTTVKEMLQFHDTFCGEARDLALERGDEYASGADTYSVFKKVGEIISEYPSKVAFTLLCIKVSRLENQMVHGNRIYDSVRDLINYAVYLTQMYKEENGH